MKRMTSIFTLMLLVFAVSWVFAGVTEFKIYTNDNPPRWYQDDSVGTNRAANYIGQSKSRVHTNGLVARIGMNADVDTRVTPPDSGQLWATHESASGPYGIKVHFVTMPNPRMWIDIQRDDTPGYTQFIDVSNTQRITFWIKAAPGTYPLWLRTRSKNHPVDGKDVYGAHICLQGETIIRMDAFGYPYAASVRPWNGDWQFISIPWELIKTSNLTDLQAVVPYSWCGHTEGDHWFGEWLDLTNFKWLSLDTREGGGETKGNFPWPKDGAGQIISVSGDFWVDEIVFTLNEGSGVSDVDGKATTMPLTYSLSDNYPNPFNPSTEIEYALPVSNQVKIEIFNTLGQKVRTLVDRFVNAGTYQVTWNGADDQNNILPSGVYFYKMQASHFTSVKKMILTK